MKALSNQPHKVKPSEGRRGHHQICMSLYGARPFVITRYAVPNANGRSQCRLQPNNRIRLAHCTAPEFIVISKSLAVTDCGRIEEKGRRGNMVF